MHNFRRDKRHYRNKPLDLRLPSYRGVHIDTSSSSSAPAPAQYFPAAIILTHPSELRTATIILLLKIRMLSSTDFKCRFRSGESIEIFLSRSKARGVVEGRRTCSSLCSFITYATKLINK